MNKIIHKAADRGYAENGWLVSHHSFSFADYYEPLKVHFGMLRVLNDDIISPGTGFGMHQHENMEIITILLEGELEHRDSTGSVSVIRRGDVQVMSAGSGITHSEYNRNDREPVELLQIWIFPDEQNLEPRYEQKSFNIEAKRNSPVQIVSPVHAGGDGLHVHQNAWLYLSVLDEGKSLNYTLRNSDHGVYIFVIEGSVDVENNKLDARDAIGIWEIDNINITAETPANILIIEVPMY